MNKASKIYKALDEEELNKVVRDYFGQEVEFEARCMKGGLFNTTYYIKVNKYKREVILRVGPVNRHLLLPFEENLMYAEEYVYKLCKENNIPCSNVLKCDLSKKIIDRDYMIIEYVNSNPLSEVDIDKKNENRIYEEVGEYISKLHKIKSNKFGRVYDVLVGNGFNSWSEYLINEFLNIEIRLREFNIFNEDELSIIKSAIYKYKYTFEKIKTPYLIHGDLWAGNILISKNINEYSTVAIIDSDRALFGDREFEFANPWITNESFIKGYGKDLECDFDSRSRRAVYSLMYLLIDSYVWSIEYNNLKCGLENKISAIKLAKELLQEYMPK